MIRPSGPCPAQIMIVGEAPGEKEWEKGVPFVGPSGWRLDQLLREVGLRREECFLTNVCRVRPPKNDITVWMSDRKTRPGEGWTRGSGLWYTPEIAEGLALLRMEIMACRPRVIVALGNVAMWAVTGEWGIKKWRGSRLAIGSAAPVAGCMVGKSPTLPAQSTEVPSRQPPSTESIPPVVVIPTYHPAAILRELYLHPIVRADLNRAARIVDGRFIPGATPAPTFTVRPTFSEVEAWFLKVLANPPPKIAADIETRAGHIACIGLAPSHHEAICIPFMQTGPDPHYWTEEEEAWIIWALAALFSSRDIQFIGQNWLYDAQYIWKHWGIRVHRVRDTMIVQHSMFSTSQKSLDFLASMYCDDYVYWKDDGKKWDASMPEDQLWEYNCWDCVRTFEVDDGQQEAVAALAASWPKLPSVVAFQQSLFQPVLSTMIRGVRCDTEKKRALSTQLGAALGERLGRIRTVLGEVNINSSPQMIDLFYEQLGQKKIWKREGGVTRLTCDDAALEVLAAREPCLRQPITWIQECRTIGKYKTNFVDMRVGADGRIRCSFNIAGAKTYRFSSSKSAFDDGANLQTIPDGEEDDEGATADSLPNLRKLFIPDEGYEIAEGDLDSADARIVAEESNCNHLRAVFREGKKLYVEVAREYLREPGFTKKDPRYRQFKAVCHGTHYGGTAAGIAHNEGLLVHEVDRLQAWYFGLAPEIKKYHARIRDEVQNRGWIENIFGYRCYFFDRITEDTFKEAYAWIPQTTVANVVNHAYVYLAEHHPWIHILLQVHDSLPKQYPIERRAEAHAAIAKAYHVILPYPTPIVIPAGLKTSVKSWGDCA